MTMLTRSEILALKKGPETDAWVHKHVMKRKLPPRNITDDSGVWVDYDYVDTKAIPPYSTDNAAAMEVWEFIANQDDEIYELTLNTLADWNTCTIARIHCKDHFNVGVAHAETPKLAICKAALLWELEKKERKESCCSCKVKG